MRVCDVTLELFFTFFNEKIDKGPVILKAILSYKKLKITITYQNQFFWIFLFPLGKVGIHPRLKKIGIYNIF
jgi:hypothetical protein